MDGFVLAIIAAVVFVTGAYIGAEAFDNSWKKDCSQLGMHRAEGDGIYKCEKVK